VLHCAFATGWPLVQRSPTKCVNTITKPLVWSGQGLYKDCRAVENDVKILVLNQTRLILHKDRISSMKINSVMVLKIIPWHLNDVHGLNRFLDVLLVVLSGFSGNLVQKATEQDKCIIAMFCTSFLHWTLIITFNRQPYVVWGVNWFIWIVMDSWKQDCEVCN
jgi:hypothetical protein